MKIGVSTYFGGTNYGTALQAYALCSLLRASGHDAEVVRYYDNSLKFQNDGRRAFGVAKITSKIADRVYIWLRRNTKKKNKMYLEYLETSMFLIAKHFTTQKP